jgi:signal transduction histidine kinase
VADLEELVGRVRGAGREVDLRVDLESDDFQLPASGARALYRIVQEALTNAVKHTSAGRIKVVVGQTGGWVAAEVFNEAHGLADPVPGRGLVNMRERARLEGGRLEAGRVDGGFRVRASVPEHARVPA